MSDLTPDEEYRREQIAEYSSYVANKPININGARAFNEGDPVPAGHVERGVVSEDDVAKTSTKAGKTAVSNNPTTEVSP